MTDKKTIIFDIDGTIANCEHRLGYVKTKPKNWKAFFLASENDPPYEDVTWMMKVLKKAGNNILIVTARPENERAVTEKWLKDKAKVSEYYDKLYMREAHDPRDDFVVKKEILDQIYLDGYTPSIVFDDRTNVVKMWRDQGLTCMQVRPGDF
jgi:phosphoglycolate phosphatase-like HAD superfamily hydrolase